MGIMIPLAAPHLYSYLYSCSSWPDIIITLRKTTNYFNYPICGLRCIACYYYLIAGQFICKLVPKGMRGGSILGDPQDIAVTHDGHILVTDCEKSCIHVFDSAGKHEKCFGLPNEFSSLSFRPSSIALDNRGRVIVTDGSAHVWMFTPDGNMLQHFGWEGQNPGDLYRPRGVAINNKNQIIVSEGGNHRISVFTSSGSFVKCLGTLGDGLGQFNGPAGVSAFQNGSKLVITDEENCRLQVYDKL